MSSIRSKGPVVIAAALVFALPAAGLAQEEAPGAEPAAADAEADASADSGRHPHQLSAGVGLMICGFGVSSGGCGEPLWVSIPLMYRYRVNDYFAAGVGAMVQILGGGIPAGGGLRAGVRLYALPDWLYFQVDVFAGYPFLFTLAPGIGHSFRITDSFAIFVENEVLLWFFDFWGAWQPVLGVEYRF